MLRTLIPDPSPSGRRKANIGVESFDVHFLPPFFRLGGGGSCLTAWSKSPPA